MFYPTKLDTYPEYIVRVDGIGYVAEQSFGDTVTPNIEDAALMWESGASESANFLEASYRRLGLDDVADGVTILRRPVNLVRGEWAPADPASRTGHKIVAGARGLG